MGFNLESMSEIPVQFYLVDHLINPAGIYPGMV